MWSWREVCGKKTGEWGLERERERERGRECESHKVNIHCRMTTIYCDSVEHMAHCECEKELEICCCCLVYPVPTCWVWLIFKDCSFPSTWSQETASYRVQPEKHSDGLQPWKKMNLVYGDSTRLHTLGIEEIISRVSLTICALYHPCWLGISPTPSPHWKGWGEGTGSPLSWNLQQLSSFGMF